jgi:hypothetical protein
MFGMEKISPKHMKQQEDEGMALCKLKWKQNS